MKKFFSDYKVLVWNPTKEWLKKHWKGYIFLCTLSGLIGYVTTYVIINKDDIQQQVSEKIFGEEIES